MADTSYMAARNTRENGMTDGINLQELAKATRAMNERVEPCRECGHVENVTQTGFCEHCIEVDLTTQARFQDWR